MLMMFVGSSFLLGCGTEDDADVSFPTLLNQKETSVLVDINTAGTVITYTTVKKAKNTGEFCDAKNVKITLTDDANLASVEIDFGTLGPGDEKVGVGKWSVSDILNLPTGYTFTKEPSSFDQGDCKAKGALGLGTPILEQKIQPPLRRGEKRSSLIQSVSRFFK